MKAIFTRILVGFTLLTLMFGAAGVMPVRAAGRANPPLAQYLNPDGTLNLDGGYTGNLDISNYSVNMDPARGPIFRPLAAANIWNALGVGLPHDVSVVAVNGTDVYVGGDFYNAGGNPDADHIARWNGSTWNALGTGLNAIVWSIVMSGTDVYAGGNFVDAGGNSNADFIAKWNGTSWSALGAGLNTSVYAIAISGANVYVGGQFTHAGGDINANRIAKWDGSVWSALGVGLNNVVNAIAISGDNVYVGGQFSNAGGDPNADYMAKWNGASWSAMGTTPLTNYVMAIAVSGTDVYAGGYFSNAGGNPNADFIAKWDGTSWSALGSGLSNQVWSIAIHGTDIYVGGNFTNAGGDANADYIAKWNGTSWAALGTRPLSGMVYGIGFSDANIYVGGYFTNAGGNGNADYIARFGLPPTVVTFYSEAERDGWMLESSENSGTGSSSIFSVGQSLYLGDTSERRQFRSILSFNTGSLPDNAVITGATLTLNKSGGSVVSGEDVPSILHGFVLDIKTGFFGGFPALQSLDFQAPADKTLGPTNSILTTPYTFGLMNGKDYINKLATNGGLTQIRVRFAWDDNNDSVGNNLSVWSGNNPPGSSPQLVITYTMP